MNFCENCNFMLYKKLAGTESCDEGIPQDSGVCDLLEYCKNCGYEKNITDDAVSVYKRNYKNSFAIDNILGNKYLVYDNTLPRLSIDCKNANCITDDRFNYLNENNSLLITNVPENIEDADIYDMLYTFPHDDSFKDGGLDAEDYIKTIRGFKMHYKRIRLCEVIVYYAHDDISTDENVKILNTINGSLKLYIENFPVKDKFQQNEKLLVKAYEHIDNEILYVKYDPENMKYLYICVNCGTSW